MGNQEIYSETSNQEGNSINVFDLFTVVKVYAKYLLRYLVFMVLAGVVLAWFLYNRKINQPTTYTASIIFQQDQANSETQSSIASVYGAAGAFLGGGSAATGFKGLNEIMKTRKFISDVLFHKALVEINGEREEDMLINHFLKKFYYGERESYENLILFDRDTIIPTDVEHNSLMNYAYSVLLNQSIIVEEINGIVTVKCISTDENFAFELVHAIYNELLDYYDLSRIRQKEVFYDMSVLRTQDLLGQLRNAEKVYISHLNSNRAEALGYHNTSIKTQYLATDLTSATEAYFMALRNQEAAWVALEKQKQSPSLKILDYPIYPLFKVSPNPFFHTIIGFVAGFGLVFIIVLGTKVIKDFLEKERLKLNSKQAQVSTDSVDA